MAKIISISLSEDLLQEMDRLEKELGFSGRSEVIRAGVRMLIADTREKQRLSGRLECLLTVIHVPDAEDALTGIKHRYEDIIRSQVHSHLRGGKCLEVFTLDGNALRVKNLVKALQACRKMEYVKLAVA